MMLPLLPNVDAWASDCSDVESAADSVGAMDSPGSPVADTSVDQWLVANDTQCNEWHYEGGELAVIVHATPLPPPPPVSPRLAKILRSFQLEPVSSVCSLRDAMCM